jgi:heme exporter protein C
MNRTTERLIDGLTIAAFAVTLYLIFIWVPTEKTMGIIQRIFYYHVPSAWIAFLAFGCVFAFSILYLIRKTEKWDHLATASAELGLGFCTIMLITGPIWAKPVWGIWWTWDARLTLSLVLWLIYVGYMMVRAYVRDESQRGRLAAVVGIIGFLDVPLVYMSIRWWRTQHPEPVIAGGEKSGLAPEMMLTFLVCLTAFTLLYVVLMNKRYRTLRSEADLRDLRRLVEAD